MSLTVGSIARLAGVTVRTLRTLHHYDEIERLQRMVTAVEKAMEARTMGISLTPEERLEVFGDFDPDEHAAEVEQRWGDSDAYRESARRAARYSKADWQRIRDESQAVVIHDAIVANAARQAD